MELVKCDDYFESVNLDGVLGVCESRYVLPYFNTYKVSLGIVGSSSSGKTTYLINLILQGKLDPFNNIIICAPAESLEADGALSRFIARCRGVPRLSKRVHVINLTKNVPTFSQFMGSADHSKPPNIVIFDDWIHAMTKKEIEVIKRLLTSISRLNAHLILLMQNLGPLDPNFTQQLTAMVVFPLYVSPSQLDMIMKNRTQANLNNKQIDDILNLAMKQENKRTPLMISNLAPINKQIRFGNSFLRMTKKNKFDQSGIDSAPDKLTIEDSTELEKGSHSMRL